MSWFWIGLGGALGACLRYAVLLLGQTLAFATPALSYLFINVLGSFAMGVLMGFLWVMDAGRAEIWRLFLSVGLLGGFTTFSAFSFEMLELIEKRDILGACFYAVGSVVLSVAFLYLGWSLQKFSSS